MNGPETHHHLRDELALPTSPPPELRARIMDVVHAEAEHFGASSDERRRRELPATVSLAVAPRARATLTLQGGRAVLRARGLPVPGAGCRYRAWLMAGPGGRHDGPRIPLPGPTIEVADDGSGWWDLGAADGVGEVLVALEGDDPNAPRRPVLRVRLP